MSEPTTTADIAAALAPVLQPASVPVPTAPGAETKPDSATPPAAAADKPTTEAPADDAAKPDDANDEPKKRSAQARINELTAQKRSAERIAEANKREADNLRQQYAQLQKAYQETDPNDFAAQQALQMRSAVKAERFQQVTQDAERQEVEARELRALGFKAKVDAVRERIPDVDQVLSPERFAQVPISETAAEIISSSDKAAEISYFLAKNLDEAHRIAALPSYKQAYELAKIEARVSTGQSRKTSNAPPPVPIVTASSAPGAIAVKDMGVGDISKMIYGR